MRCLSFPLSLFLWGDTLLGGWGYKSQTGKVEGQPQAEQGNEYDI
jgi:hypothetical protein